VLIGIVILNSRGDNLGKDDCTIAVVVVFVVVLSSVVVVVDVVVVLLLIGSKIKHVVHSYV